MELELSIVKKTIKRLAYLSIALLFIASTIFWLLFPNTTSFIICLISNTLPDSSHIVRIRNDLENQSSFLNTLSKHEKLALSQYKNDSRTVFIKKYIHRTSTAMFDIPAFHDDWEVWVRTDIVNGKSLTSYLVRLGLIKDTNASSFFSNQCDSEYCESFMIFVVDTYNKMYDWGIFHSVRLNITEMDETSTVSRERLSLDEWHVMVDNLHKREVGRNYSSISND